MIRRRTPLRRGSTPLRRGSRPAPVRKAGPARALKLAGTLMSRLVVERDGHRCQIDIDRWRPGKQHTTWLPLQAMHGISRRYHATTLDSRNLFAGCAGCHQYFTHRPEEWTEWLRERMGADEHEALRRVALARPRLDAVDGLEAVRQGLDTRSLWPDEPFGWRHTPVVR